MMPRFLDKPDVMDVATPMLSETGYYRVGAPLLALWGARALYVGPPFELSAHRNAVAVLAVGIAAPFGVAVDPRSLSPQYRPCSTALIKPNSLHHFVAKGPMAFLYLDALGNDYPTILAKAQERLAEVAFDLNGEVEIVETLRSFCEDFASWPVARDRLVSLLGFRAGKSIDARIAAAIRVLQEAPDQQSDATELAADSGMSTSRFLHLFSDATGVPFRRYRLWCRLSAAVRAAQAGMSLTDAALAGGLSSSAHLSAAFREMFGISPSQLDWKTLILIDEAAGI